ncbi:MAG: sigma-54-dependent Fis family transcriptional regulator [Candidatus Eisenbacteria bacterium]|uniref:Sigma-54-dependent Fis family transcriptional regulator n=1 Tax=Eiseniibacteriota bacterium TaxID=2212470 RepID=A0A9D6LAI1_UNCEI|nr:sigma-54-dependent Fis family transcriptional regulator [Candidatus Eisenbacteria bacterium]MBI3539628.1 sigma-54-dependent Fis family transcriptional regulator [Candidatus Eisenbacteria bacterium]
MPADKILVVDDEQSMTQFLSIVLRKEGFQVTAVNNGKDALDKVRAEGFDVVITDIKMPGMDGIQLLSQLKKHDPSLPVVIMTAYASQQSAIDAVNMGAFQYLIKNAKNDEIKLVVRNALEMRKVRSENLFLKRELKKGHEEKVIIGSSDEMVRVFKMVDKVADSEATILIQGESGTGKELIAREIHYRSGKAQGPFVSINCGAIPRDLLESNLFGHVKGSFTGAVRDSAGLFQVAEGGTFFLDEVGDMPLATQVKLLRALQEREIIPVGGTQPIKIDCRLVAATNADLEKDVSTGRFRADLFYRLNVIPIRLPALRERRDDIHLLVDHFLKRHAHGGTPKLMSKEAMDLLLRYDWPGNVRELENVMERALILDESGTIGPEDLPEKIRFGHSQRGSLVIDTPTLTLEELEKEYIMKVLNHTRWQKKRASEVLGINASTLYRKLLGYGLDKGERPEHMETPETPDAHAA